MKSRLVILILLLEGLCVNVYPYRVNSTITLRKYCLWQPLCCAKMVSLHHPDTLVRCADIDYIRWACSPDENIYTIAEKIDTGFVFFVQDSIYERESKDAIRPDSIIDSLFLHEGIGAVVNRYFVFYQDNWYLTVLCNRVGETVIATKNPRVNDLRPGDTYSSTNIDYLLFRLQQERVFCCFDEFLNIILIHNVDFGSPYHRVDVR